MQTSKKVILLFHVILLVVFAIAVHRQVESSYMRIGEKSDAIINEAADVYMYDIYLHEYNSYISYSLDTKGTIPYATASSGNLEYEIDGVWFKLEMKSHAYSGGKPVFYSPEEYACESFLAEWHYGRLRKGHYRLLRAIVEHGENGEHRNYVIAIEFDIP